METFIKLAIATLLIAAGVGYFSHPSVEQTVATPAAPAPNYSGFSSQNPNVTPPPPGPSHLGIGDMGTIDDGSNSPVPLSSTQDGYEEMAKAGRAHDTVGIRQMVLLGRVFAVPVGTVARVIDTSFAMRRVRILNGKYKDAAGWLPYGNVR